MPTPTAPQPSDTTASVPTLDLALLRTFVQVASGASFASTGDKIRLSQSGVSQQMQRLEAQVGAAIFRKVGRSKELSPDGQKLLRYAREMLSLNDDAILALRPHTDSVTIRIGSTHDVADTILPQVLSRLSRLMPTLVLETHVGRSPALIAALQAGELDLAICNREAPTLEGFVLRRSPTVWLCATHFLLPPRQPIPLVLGDESSIFRRFALDALERHRLQWRLAHLSSSPIGVKAALRAGLGVTARSMEMVGPETRILSEHDGFPRLPEIKYYLWMRPQTLNTHVRQAYRLLQEGQSFLRHKSR